jgi:hypothetical protein
MARLVRGAEGEAWLETGKPAPPPGWKVASETLFVMVSNAVMVLYVEGAHIPPEHHELPYRKAELREGAWVPVGRVMGRKEG